MTESTTSVLSIGKDDLTASRRKFLHGSLLGAGLVMAGLAAIAGLTDVLGDIQIRNLTTAWLHAGGNVVAVLIELYNWASRYARGSAAILPIGLILSVIVVCILLFHRLEGLGDGLSPSRRGCRRPRCRIVMVGSVLA